MKRTFFLAGLSLLLAAQSQAQSPQAIAAVSPKASPVTAQAEARFSFKEAADTYDFGKIPEGPEVTHEFSFKNTGTTPLIISNGNASCGCTSPKWPSEPILPGKTGKVQVTFRTEGKPGAFAKTVYLTSNAPAKNGSDKYELYIKGEVIPKASTSSR